MVDGRRALSAVRTYFSGDGWDIDVVAPATAAALAIRRLPRLVVAGACIAIVVAFGVDRRLDARDVIVFDVLFVAWMTVLDGAVSWRLRGDLFVAAISAALAAAVAGERPASVALAAGTIGVGCVALGVAVRVLHGRSRG